MMAECPPACSETNVRLSNGASASCSALQELAHALCPDAHGHACACVDCKHTGNSKPYAHMYNLAVCKLHDVAVAYSGRWSHAPDVSYASSLPSIQWSCRLHRLFRSSQLGNDRNPTRQCLLCHALHMAYAVVYVRNARPHHGLAAAVKYKLKASQFVIMAAVPRFMRFPSWRAARHACICAITGPLCGVRGVLLCSSRVAVIAEDPLKSSPYRCESCMPAHKLQLAWQRWCTFRAEHSLRAHPAWGHMMDWGPSTKSAQS